jgi:hypothetical protein
MQELGFRATPCGEDGPAARLRAAALYEEWIECRKHNRLSSQVSEMEKRRPKEYPADIGYVYFYKVGDFIKIGFTKKPIQRVENLKVAQSALADMFVAVRGRRSDEKALHRALESFHNHGEWYRATSSVMTIVVRAIIAGQASDLAIRRGTFLQQNGETRRQVAKDNKTERLETVQ